MTRSRFWFLWTLSVLVWCLAFTTWYAVNQRWWFFAIEASLAAFNAALAKGWLAQLRRERERSRR